jgi:hypothetical protein
MPISGVVFNLKPGPEGEAALVALKARPELTLGDRLGNQLAAAMDTQDVPAARDLHDWINAQPGIDYVDVVRVNFELDRPDPCQSTNLAHTL